MFFCWKLKVEHLWKKRETILESWKLLVAKASVNSFGLQEKKKNKAFLYWKLRLLKMTKLCSFCFRQSLPMAKKQNREHLPLKTKQRCFVFVFFRFVFSSKMKKAKNKQTRSEVFFLFVKTTMLLCKTMKHFFVSQLSKTNKPLAIAFGWKKKQLFFLA